MEKEISKTKIEKRIMQKTNPILVNTLLILKKKNPTVAKLLAMPVKKQKVFNLSDLDKETKEGEKIFVAGKILSAGTLTKKFKIVSWNASESALEKMKLAKVEFTHLVEEVKKNPELKDLRIIK